MGVEPHLHHMHMSVNVRIKINSARVYASINMLNLCLVQDATLFHYTTSDTLLLQEHSKICICRKSASILALN